MAEIDDSVIVTKAKKFVIAILPH